VGERKVSVIRFGLGAIKNVGQGPVEEILSARQGGIFNDVNDFAHRVDLRNVGRRALECLVKVGALDSVGERASLLESLDSIIAISNSHFKAVETGQMSLFGDHTGIVDIISLQATGSQLDRKEILNWERELLGLYVSDHPLNPYMDDIREIVTHYSGQLNEVSVNDKVRVAGLITKIRPHQTRSGKAMGFITIEDLQGSIDLVLFPSIWERYTNIIEFDQVVIVEGRVDNTSAESKILVDHISTEIYLRTPVNDSFSPDDEYDYFNSGEIFVSDDGEINFGEIPPPPEEFSDKQIQDVPSDDIDQGDNIVSQRDGVSSLEVTDDDVPENIDPPNFPPKVTLEEEHSSISEISEEPDLPLPKFILSPIISETDEQEVYMITLLIRSLGDKTRDELKLRRIHGIITSYPGNDRFAFHLFEKGRGYLLEFPNYTVGLCDEMMVRLQPIVGKDNIRVEKITFQ